jgi:hypothetical protein
VFAFPIGRGAPSKCPSACIRSSSSLASPCSWDATSNPRSRSRQEFGGGIVPELNELTGLTTIAPECNQLVPSDFLAPGASSSEEEEEAGVEKYQCCIHPWMRAEVRITEK